MMSMMRSAEAIAVYIYCMLVSRIEPEAVQGGRIQIMTITKSFMGKTDHIRVTTCTWYIYIPLIDHD